MSRLVDDGRLAQWRALDALDVLGRLGCYAKRDVSFRPVAAAGTTRYHVNANGRDWELLLTGPKFWDTRANKGGGGAIDLAMHLFALDFKRSVRMLRTVLSEDPAIASTHSACDCSEMNILNISAGLDNGAA
jgi:hypothetical protein